MTSRRHGWRVLVFAAGLLGMTSGSHAQTPASPAPKPAQIDRNGVVILIRSTLLALDQANKTGNYTVLRDIGAPEFQSNTAARLGEIFAKLRNDNLDLSGVAVIDPQLNLLPQIEANGLMRMAGVFSVGADPGQFRSRVRSGEWTMAAVRPFRADRTGRARRARTTSRPKTAYSPNSGKPAAAAKPPIPAIKPLPSDNGQQSK